MHANTGMCARGCLKDSSQSSYRMPTGFSTMDTYTAYHMACKKALGKSHEVETYVYENICAQVVDP